MIVEDQISPQVLLDKGCSIGLALFQGFWNHVPSPIVPIKFLDPLSLILPQLEQVQVLDPTDEHPGLCLDGYGSQFLFFDLPLGF